MVEILMEMQLDQSLKFVTSKDIYQTNHPDKFHPEGLYSEVIFGPKFAYRCTCGALNESSYAGETCETCGVLCTSETMRENQFAKIKLPKKILWPIFYKQLCSIFGIKAIKDIFNLAKYNINCEEPYYLDFTKLVLRKANQIKNLEATVFKDYPVYDIKSLQDLYFYMLSDKLSSVIIKKAIPRFAEFVFIDEIIVVPPTSRPIIMSGGKKIFPNCQSFIEVF